MFTNSVHPCTAWSHRIETVNWQASHNHLHGSLVMLAEVDFRMLGNRREAKRKKALTGTGGAGLGDEARKKEGQWWE